MALVLGGFDVVGDEDEMEGDLVIGRAARGRGLGSRLARSVKVPTPKWMRATTSQGVSRPEEEMDFLPFDPVTLSATVLTGTLVGKPQRPFRGERLIMDAVSDGDSAASNVVIDPAIYVGAVQVGSSQGATPLSTFASQAFGVRLSMPAAGQGTEVKIFVRALTTPGADTVVTATVVGRSMR